MNLMHFRLSLQNTGQYEAIMKLVGTGFSGELDDRTMEAYEKRVGFRELEDYVIVVVTK